MTDDIVMNPSVRKALWGELLLLFVGCAPSLPEHGDNPQGLRHEMWSWITGVHAHSNIRRMKISFTTRGTPFPFDQGSQSPSNHARALHGLSSINAMRDICLAPKGYRVEQTEGEMPPASSSHRSDHRRTRPCGRTFLTMLPSHVSTAHVAVFAPDFH